MPQTFDPRQPPPDARNFFHHVLGVLERADVPVLVGGGCAFTRYTGIRRPTKDFDVFVRGEDVDRALGVLADAGVRTDLTYPHWLAKVFSGDIFIDVIFNSGNGVVPVDEEWFRHSSGCRILERDVRLVPPEELLWSKAFIMERERYDGADVIHLLHACGEKLDWPRLLRRFDTRWRVLLAHLVLYGFVYPGEAEPAPRWLMDDLLGRLTRERRGLESDERICQGTLLSRAQYLVDVEYAGYADARLEPRGTMSREDVAHWTAAIEHEK